MRQLGLVGCLKMFCWMIGKVEMLKVGLAHPYRSTMVSANTIRGSRITCGIFVSWKVFFFPEFTPRHIDKS